MKLASRLQIGVGFVQEYFKALDHYNAVKYGGDPHKDGAFEEALEGLRKAENTLREKVGFPYSLRSL